MSENLEIEVGPDGTIRTIYQDGIAELLGAELQSVKRASRVEFEDVGIDGKIESGWSIRAEWDPELALRRVAMFSGSRTFLFKVSRDPKSKLVVFKDRVLALQFERDYFWDLLPPRICNDPKHGTPCKYADCKACQEEGCKPEERT